MFFYHYNSVINYLFNRFVCYYKSVSIRLNHIDKQIIGLWIMLICCMLICYTLIYLYAALIVTIIVTILVMTIAVIFVIRFQFSYIKSISFTGSYNSYPTVTQCNMKDLDVFVGSWRGLKQSMEDFHVVCPKNRIFGVFDGHGGKDVAKFLRDSICSEYEEIFHDIMIEKSNDSLSNVIISALEKSIINIDIMTYYKKILGGAVASIVKIDSDIIYCSSVGDTSAFLIDSNDTVQTLTNSHAITNLYEYIRYSNTIYPKYPRIGNVLRTKSGLIPTRTIGDHKQKSNDNGLLNIPESKIINLEGSPGWKMILIASDGVWDCVTPHFIKKIITDNPIDIQGAPRYENIKNVMKKLSKMTTREPNIFDKFLGRYYGDNCTLIIIFNKK